tara:strand:+ start:1036 stop:1410 length:375 start_codon:yes stop_codon:yes gene_type:complete
LIRNPQIITDNFYNYKKILHEVIMKKDIAVSLEILASTFSCDVPNNIGLNQYAKLLSKYPAVFLPHATDELCITNKYRNIPLPRDFIEILDPLYKEAWKFVYDLEKTVKIIEKYKEDKIEWVKK